jgi:HSP20 family protein
MELLFENGWTGNPGWLFNRMNGVLREMNGSSRWISPKTDVVEEKDAYHFYFEMPGLSNDAFDVNVESGALRITAERKRPERSSDVHTHVSERDYGTIRRAFELPEDACPDKVQATYKDGILTVTVEKRPESKPVKIQVN